MAKKILKVLFFMVILFYEYCGAEIDLATESGKIIVIQDNHIIHEANNKINITENKQQQKVLENSLEGIITSTESFKNASSSPLPPSSTILANDTKTTSLNTTEITLTTTITERIIKNSSLTEAPILNITSTSGIITINSTESPIITTAAATTIITTAASVQQQLLSENDDKQETNANKVLNAMPSDCSQREILKKQPKNNDNSSWRKCCPHGESLNINESDQLCMPSEGNDYQAEIIEVILYDNCIEDMETQPQLPVEIGNQCNKSFIYNSEEDRFVVLQDGSLLVMDKNANESYTIENNYCLDYDYDSNSEGNVYAIICITSVEEHLNRSQVVVVAIFMLISIPFLFLLAYLHIRIKALRTLHGLSLSCMSFCLAMGYLLYALAYIFNYANSKVGGYTTQFFILSYFVWFLCICFNSCLNIWYKFPKQQGLNKVFKIYNFFIYLIIAIAISTTLVIMSIQKGLPGMPSYFVQGFTESIRESQRYFIPPISTILVLCFLLIVASFFGFQRIKKLGNDNNKSHTNIYAGLDAKFDMEIYAEIKKDAKCISLLWLVMAITWLLEIVTFYSPGPENYLMFMEILNGLQGIFVLLIFFVVRNRRAIILHWWYDRGTHNLEAVEMRTINHKRNENN